MTFNHGVRSSSLLWLIKSVFYLHGKRNVECMLICCTLYFLYKFLWKKLVLLDYVIRNGAIFIKLNDNGAPVTCAESQKGLFEYSKAKNICASLPKTLKKMNFRVEAIPDIPPKVEEQKVIKNTYAPSENVTRWIEKLGQLEDVLTEVSERDEELNVELSDVDLKLQDILHTIELSDKCDMYKSWKIMNEIRDLRKQRRNIKDEKLVLSGIKSQGITYLSRSSVQKCVDGLSKRKYRIRIVEEEEDTW